MEKTNEENMKGGIKDAEKEVIKDWEVKNKPELNKLGWYKRNSIITFLKGLLFVVLIILLVGTIYLILAYPEDVKDLFKSEINQTCSNECNCEPTTCPTCPSLNCPDVNCGNVNIINGTY